MQSRQTWNLVSQPELIVGVAHSIDGCGQVLTDRLDSELRIAHLRLLRRQRRCQQKNHECGEWSFHGRLLFVEKFQHVVGGFLAVHHRQLVDNVLPGGEILFASRQGHKVVGIAGNKQRIGYGFF